MQSHVFEWKKSQHVSTWELLMDGLAVYFLFKADDKGRMWGAFDNYHGVVPELAGLRWLDVEEAKKHVTEIVAERYGKTPPLSPDYVKFSNEESERVLEPQQSSKAPSNKSFAESFLLADRQGDDNITDNYWL